MSPVERNSAPYRAKRIVKNRMVSDKAVKIGMRKAVRPPWLQFRRPRGDWGRWSRLCPRVVGVDGCGWAVRGNPWIAPEKDAFRLSCQR